LIWIEAAKPWVLMSRREMVYLRHRTIKFYITFQVVFIYYYYYYYVDAWAFLLRNVQFSEI